MPTLHIEHPITDFATWRAAFERFADAREIRAMRPADAATGRGPA